MHARQRLALALALSLLPSAVRGQAATNVRVQNVIRQFVGSTGQSIIGLGSWITGKKYDDVLLAGGHSDHDLRLISRATSPAEAQREWLRARSALADAVKKEFGKDADKVLNSINLYPPSQLMSGVEDAADALGRFNKLGNVPNLGYAGPVGSAPAKFAEGLYGPGAKVWTQAYEQQAGRIFYEREGRVFAGATDLTHLSEGIAKYDIAGMCNTTTQWADHIVEELAGGRGDKVAKYIERLDRDLAKARDLSRIAPDPTWRAQLKNLAETLRRNPGRVGELEGEINAVLRRSRAEAAIISRIGKGTSAMSRILTSALDQIRKSGTLQRILDRAGETVTLDNALQAMAVIMQVRQTARFAGEEDYNQAVASAVSGVAGLASLPVSVLLEMTNWVLQTARANGYTFVASTQEAWDLMAGVYSAVGRADVDAGRGYTLDQLVASIDDEARLSAIVYAKAMLAGARDIGAITGRDDRAAGEAIFARCYPVILAAWRARREELAAEYAGILDALAGTPVLGSYTPLPARVRAKERIRVTVTAQVDDRAFDRKMERARQILVILCKRDVFSDFSWNWTGGTASTAPSKRVYEFSSAGTFPASTVLKVSAGAANACGARMTRRFELRFGLDIVVEGEGKAVAVTPRAGPANEAPWLFVSPRADWKVDVNVIAPVSVAKMVAGDRWMSGTDAAGFTAKYFHRYLTSEAYPGYRQFASSTAHWEKVGDITIMLFHWSPYLELQWSKSALPGAAGTRTPQPGEVVLPPTTVDLPNLGIRQMTCQRWTWSYSYIGCRGPIGDGYAISLEISSRGRGSSSPLDDGITDAAVLAARKAVDARLTREMEDETLAFLRSMRVNRAEMPPLPPIEPMPGRMKP